MATIASGVIMRIGTYDTANYEGRTQREVHGSRRDESITYSIRSVDSVAQPSKDADGWEHYKYVFTYRHLGRTLSVTWRCGTAYGSPKPEDGLRSAFLDAECIAYKSFQEFVDDFGYDLDTDYGKARRAYDACVQMNERLDRFFGADWSREAWATAVHED